MKTTINNVSKFIDDHQFALTSITGAALGAAAVLIVNKKTSMQLLVREAHAQKMLESGGRVVFDTPRGKITVRLHK